MPITDWPITKYPNEKLQARGVKGLSNAELLAIFIQSGIKNKTAIDLAYSLLNRFGGIRNLFDATEEQICTTNSGLDQTKYKLLQAALEISHRHLEEQLVNTDIISNAEAAHLYLTAKLRDHKREVFACLFLNNQNRVLHYEELFYGTINTIAIYPREIVKTALQYNTYAVILAHNHPSGTPAPSPQDKHLTKNLIKILRPLDIKVLDHIIIGSNSHISLIKKKCATPPKAHNRCHEMKIYH